MNVIAIQRLELALKGALMLMNREDKIGVAQWMVDAGQRLLTDLNAGSSVRPPAIATFEPRKTGR